MDTWVVENKSFFGQVPVDDFQFIPSVPGD
jgi:hypothetical protein